MRSHRIRKCSSMGKNGKGNCGKMLHFIEHLNVRGEMRCNREDPDAVYNIIQGWVLRARMILSVLTCARKQSVEINVHCLFCEKIATLHYNTLNPMYLYCIVITFMPLIIKILKLTLCF